VMAPSCLVPVLRFSGRPANGSARIAHRLR
jgi:hypothetical protein